MIVTGRRASRGHPLTVAFADLKNWRILTKVRMNVRHAIALLRALLVLANAEISR
ncbi:hypothetical protein GCM10010420_34560 [Streptomyces glaucosporus]|uniref:Transposase n=1 Tax=Streptomyces glaucosporus TaxID=284044 RepID=A0ABN3IHT4_9ACTN